MERDADWFRRNSDYPSSDHPACPPESFPPPQRDNCTRISTNVLINGKVKLAKNVLIPSVGETAPEQCTNPPSSDAMDEYYSSDDEGKRDVNPDDNDDPKPTRAYWYLKKIRRAIFGTVWRAVLLIPCTSTSHPGVEWQATTEYCAIKEMDCDEIMERQGSSAEDPLCEVSAMQYCQRYLRKVVEAEQVGGGPTHPVEYNQRAIQQVLEHHVMMPLDVLTDSRYLYLVMPFIPGGELFDVLSNRNKFSQDEARIYLRHMLKGVEFLQRAGICHRDLSLENLLMDQDRNIAVIDLGMCLKIPYRKGHNDVSDHRLRERCLITPQGSVGKRYYMSPEIVKNREPFDGYAIDLWALGAILFLMVTGFPPWERAIMTDQRFNLFSNGYLTHAMQRWNLGLDPDLVDLMQRMFWRDPRMRLSLEQVRAHPWVKG